MYSAANPNASSAMDYSYYAHTPQAYFMDMQPPGAFSTQQQGLDPETIRSIVC